VRVFVAVPIPVRIQRELSRLARKLAETAIPVRWIPPENLHLTLRFLGQQPDEGRRLIVETLARAAEDTMPFMASFGSVGAFPSPRRPRVIWIAVDSVPQLRILRASVDRQLARAGFGTGDAPFHPHVTLGRAARGSEPGAFREFVPASRNLGVGSDLRVSSIDLMRSHLRSSGVQYELLDRIRLGVGTLPAAEPRT
jgi:RNA 2',3'-cyclic 3'-phosphodiesterase